MSAIRNVLAIVTTTVLGVTVEVCAFAAPPTLIAIDFQKVNQSHGPACDKILSLQHHSVPQLLQVFSSPNIAVDFGAVAQVLADAYLERDVSLGQVMKLIPMGQIAAAQEIVTRDGANWFSASAARHVQSLLFDQQSGHLRGLAFENNADLETYLGEELKIQSSAENHQKKANPFLRYGWDALEIRRTGPRWSPVELSAIVGSLRHLTIGQSHLDTAGLVRLANMGLRTVSLPQNENYTDEQSPDAQAIELLRNRAELVAFRQRTVGRPHGCFTAGTLVDTPRGQVAIETLRPGETVISYKENQDGRLTPSHGSFGRVTQAMAFESEDLYVMTLSDGRILQVTGSHPFYHPGRNAYVNVSELKSGDPLLDFKAPGVRIRSLTRKPGHHRVYNIEVEGFHNYSVDGIVVHNKGFTSA